MQDLRVLKGRYFYAPYENLVRKHAPGKPIVGAGSNLDDSLFDRSHKAYRATEHLGDTQKRLNEAGTQEKLDKVELIENLIRIYPGKKGQSALSPTFIKSIREGLAVFPRSCMALLTQEHCEVRLAPLLTDAAPHLTGQHPPGYDDYATWDDSGGVFTQGHAITVSEYKIWQGRQVAVKDCDRVIQHEAAHALDKCLNFPSQSIEFIDAYEKDRKELSAAGRDFEAYYMQEHERGPREVFAEMLASYYGDAIDKRWRHLPRSFPRCYEIVKAMFAETEQASKK